MEERTVYHLSVWLVRPSPSPSPDCDLCRQGVKPTSLHVQNPHLCEEGPLRLGLRAEITKELSLHVGFEVASQTVLQEGAKLRRTAAWVHLLQSLLGAIGTRAGARKAHPRAHVSVYKQT